MGLRHRSIRLRVGILIALPVLCLLLLYAFTASLTLNTALTQIRAKTLRADVVNQLTAFQKQAAKECAFALLSLAAPTDPQFAGALGIQEAATSKALSQLEADFRSPAVTGNATATELTAIHEMVAEAAELNLTRSAVADNAITKQTALANYDSIVESGNRVIGAIIATQATAAMATQDTDLLDLDRADQAAAAEVDFLSADLLQGSFPDVDRITFASLASTRQQLVDDSLPGLDAPSQSAWAKYVTAPVSNAMMAAESTITNTSWRFGVPPPSVLQARTAITNYTVATGSALTLAGARLQRTLDDQASSAELEIGLAIGLGLLAIIASLLMSGLIGRGLVRELRELRASALSLANDELPRVMSQVRAGEVVELDEHGTTGDETRNEIEQVRNAFTVVQRAAVQSAVDEARLRRGISDVFRNLAGRSQSLLHRQLTLLDGMERRASEPEQLEDLFRIDHLTTRMRRHAEGLVILSGDTPARGWRQPVPLIDVLRAAVAEVEDYTRIRVLCRTGAAVAGHAVADIIHLLAELAENATVFSPPNTPVRMQGDMVGRGFAIEIEDRGLGISAVRLDEINANLANPPQFDLSGSDRLGLFIAGQLALRHEIKVTLRPSVYGGTTAIVLIPIALVVDETAIGRGPALAAGRGDGSRYDRIGGRHAALTAIPAGSGHTPSAGNGHPSYPSPTGTPERTLTGSGFSFGRLTPRDADGNDGGSGPAQPLRLATPIQDGEGDDKGLTPTEVGELGLPVRVRQASLAPQLRDAPPPDESAFVTGGFSRPGRRPPQAEPAARPDDIDRPAAAVPPTSPEAARDMVSALQRGWQRGRAATPPDAVEPTERMDPAGSADAGSGASVLERNWQLGGSAAPAEPAAAPDRTYPDGSAGAGADTSAFGRGWQLGGSAVPAEPAAAPDRTYPGGTAGAGADTSAFGRGWQFGRRAAPAEPAASPDQPDAGGSADAGSGASGLGRRWRLGRLAGQAGPTPTGEWPDRDESAGARYSEDE
jgi:signal transduction histidine kinase